MAKNKNRFLIAMMLYNVMVMPLYCFHLSTRYREQFSPFTARLVLLMNV